MRPLRDWPFRRRLMLAMTLTTASALVVTAAGLLAFEAVRSHRRAIGELSSIAELVAAGSGAALTFGDSAAARETLESLRGRGDVACAALYDTRSERLAGYCRSAAEPPASPGLDRLEVDAAELLLVRPVEIGGERVGTCLVRATLEPASARLRGYGLTLLLIALAAMAAATGISARLQRSLSRPIQTLAETARAVARDGNYALRAPRLGADELGALTDGFNTMLACIEEQDAALRRARDELRLWLEAQGEDLRFESGERRRAQEFSERLLQAVQGSRDMISIADTEDRLIFVNRAFLEAYGLSEREALGRHIGVVWSQSNPPELRREIVEATRRGGWQGELVNRRKDGSEFPIFLSTSVARDASGAAVALLGVARDISEHRARETRLRLQEAALAATVDGVLITDREGTIEWVNPAFTLLTGYAAEEAVGRSPRLLRSGRQPPAFYQEMWATLLAGRVWRGQLVNRRKDGSLYTEEMTITPVPDAAGRIAHFASIKRDVSERLALESSLHGARRMEALGQLAGGVAHDFNNLLGVIRGHGELLAGQLAEQDPRRERVSEILEAARRAALLTRQLLAVGRRQVLAPRVVDLNELVAGAEGLLRRLVGESVELSVTPGRGLGRVRVDPTQVDQILLNLAANARDAMPGGGRLTIETANVELSAAEANARQGAHAGAYVRLRVGDTGVGIDEETRAHLFEPFFTTKAVGSGTGLGLATVYGIVKQSGGYVWVDSAPGRGARFDVYLPKVDDPPTPAPPPPVAPPRPTAATILLVEDEPSLREIAQELLETSGYTVHAAPSGREALALVEARPGEPADLLLTDVVMPGIGGPELAARVRALWPAVRKQGLLDHGSGLLAKPFSLDALVRAVEEALAASPAPVPASPAPVRA